jgi:hypothetical protein
MKALAIFLCVYQTGGMLSYCLPLDDPRRSATTANQWSACQSLAASWPVPASGGFVQCENRP